jgi:hypothetical protein
MQKMQNLKEGFSYKDLTGMMKNTIHIDEFSSKMGDDDEIVVASFYVRDKQAAEDLVDWFEKGYDFILDADMSPGEVKPNRYLVYVEMKRRSSTGAKLNEILDDFSTLTEYEGSQWTMHYEGKDYEWNPDTFKEMVPDSPAEYRARKEAKLNEMRIASGLPTKDVYERTSDIKKLQNAAGVI